MADMMQNHIQTPQKIVGFMSLQVTDALLDEDLFPDETTHEDAQILFALAVISALPPVPANRNILDSTFTYLRTPGVVPSAGPDDFFSLDYNDFVVYYNKLIPVFIKSCKLPAGAPHSYPYEMLAKVAASMMRFDEDAARVFHLETWLTYYCKDALLMFYDEETERSTFNLWSEPTPEDAYDFLNKHVNNVVTDETFFGGDIPPVSTEVFSALFAFLVLVPPLQSRSLMYATLSKMHELFSQNNYPLVFFDRIMHYTEIFEEIYTKSLPQNTGRAGAYTYDMMAAEAARLMGKGNDMLLRYNITAYFPLLITDAVQDLFT
ncbi:MAG: hypothetical protein ACK5JF_09855 [Oscillospiraceae bacterium]